MASERPIPAGKGASNATASREIAKVGEAAGRDTGSYGHRA